MSAQLLLQPISHLLPPQSPQLSHSPHTPNNQPSLPFPKNYHQALQICHSTYAAILDACKCPTLGKQVHAHATKTGYRYHEFVGTKLLQMYARCGCLDDAYYLFDEMHHRNLYSWTAILNVVLDHGFFEEAFRLFKELQLEDIWLDFFVFPVVFKISSGIGSVELGRKFHGLVTKCGFGACNVYVGNGLIDMYGKCGSLDEAKQVLGKMPERDRVSWNSVITACVANGMVDEALGFLEKMTSLDGLAPNLVTWSALIAGFAQNGQDEGAMELLRKMLAEGIEPNARTLASVLPACARLRDLCLGKELHGYVVRHRFLSSQYVVNGLVDVYRRCGDMGSAHRIFEKFSVKDVVSCNTMIVGYCENGDVSTARKFFDHMEHIGIKRDLISWNSMISGYVGNFMFDEALGMFRDLLMAEGIELSSFTLGSALAACTNMDSLRKGREVHLHAIVRGLQSNTFVGGALVEMYSKCQDLVAAQRAFDEVIERDIPMWNSLISGYARCNGAGRIADLLKKMKQDECEADVYTWNGILVGLVENSHLDLAIQLFLEMQESRLRPDIYTVCVILSTCSRLGTLERGKQLHAYSIRYAYDSDVHIEAALVDMYAKCGCLKYAQTAYCRISSQNLVSHNAMLTAYAMHGYGKEGVALFRKVMVNGIVPDHVTFLSVLSSCVHAGSVQTGYEIFDMMGYYKLKPTQKHYTCMVDLLSRSGHLHEAYELIKKMPMKPDSVLWGALLGGCAIHGNIELGKIAAERLMELEPNSTGNYVLLANLYAQVRRWSDLARVRQIMKERGIHKSPGCSWIEDGDEIHTFLAYGRAHERRGEIYAALDNLALHMKTKGDLSCTATGAA